MVDGSRASQSMFPTPTVLPCLRLWVPSMFRSTHGVASTLRTIVRDLDPDLAVPAVRPMNDLVEASVAQRRFQMNLVTLLAGTGLLLVCLGIYGVVSQAVTQRTAEFGIRMALGANTRRILRTVIAQGCCRWPWA